MAIIECFAGVAVADCGSALAWYDRLFGKPPDFFPTRAKPFGASPSMPGSTSSPTPSARVGRWSRSSWRIWTTRSLKLH